MGVKLFDLYNWWKEEGEFMKDFFEKAPVACAYEKVILDENGEIYDYQFININEEFQNTFGYTSEELFLKNYLSFIHKDDLDTTVEAINDNKNKKSVLTFINRYLCKDGIYRYIEWRTKNYGEYIYLSATDITKTKEIQEELEKFNLELSKLADELKEKNDMLEVRANKDNLTALYNRNFFNEIIEDEMDKCDINDEAMSLIIFDLDHFKNVNDTWGHPVGDTVLKTTAEIASNEIRKSDILFRWGGEEFIILMKKTNGSEAVCLAEKIREEIEKNIYVEVGHITCSFGVAERNRYEPFRSWYKKADEAVYFAKDEGRNRIVNFYDRKNQKAVSINLAWKRGLESSEQIIDKQHYKILELGSRLMNKYYDDIEPTEIEEELNMLLKEIEEHFEYEEMVLKSINYPNILEHIELHKDLIQKALRLKNYYETGQLKSVELISFILHDVIIGHLKEQDVLYFPYVKH